ncbi:MAG TPA: hypothetical protein VKR32_14230 [Puia sp.]|nr:hypothetical protein [Puia sp.]
MQTAILELHSILRWAILILLVASVIASFRRWAGNRQFEGGNRTIFILTLISTHLNFLVGLYLLLFGRYGVIGAQLPPGVNIMKERFYRFFLIEHPTGMLIAIVLVTLGSRFSKMNKSGKGQYKKAFWCFLIALLIVLLMIPWPFMSGIGRPLI